MRTLLAAAALLLVAWVAYLPAVSVDGWGGTEGRRVEIVREMSASGDLVVPTLGLEPTLAKPPVFYWTLTAFEHLFGFSQWSMRAPSVLTLWLCALLVFAVLRRSHDELVGWIGALGILCSPVMLHHGGFAEIDPMFAAWTAASILVLGHGVGFGSRAALLGAGILGAGAMLTKGPPYFMFLAGPLLVWIRRQRCRGVAWFLVPLIVPTVAYYWVLDAHPAAAALASVAQEETVDRLFTYEWSHVLDIPMHFVRGIAIMLPFAFWMFAEFRGTHEAHLARAELQQRFCTGAALGAVLLLTLFPGRAVRYLLPAVILFNAGVAPGVCGFLRFPAELGPTPRAIVRGVGWLAALVLCVLPFLPYPMPGRSVALAGLLAVAPFFVTTRLRVVGYALAVPVLAAWTALADRSGMYEHGTRSSEDIRVLLREEIDARGIEDVSTFGHFTYSHVFGWDTLIPGDERMVRTPTTRWLLVEHRGELLPRPEGYVDRVRLRARRRTVVLMERDD